MAYLSPLKSLPQKLSEPSSLAIVASVGIHGILFAFLPLLSSFSEAAEPDPLEPVPLVELSPSEQRRLPNLDRTPPALPPLGQPDLFGTTPLPPSGDLFSMPLPGPLTPSFPSSSVPRASVPRTPFPGGVLIRPSVPITPAPAPSIQRSASAPRSQIQIPAPAEQPRPDPLAGQAGVSSRIPELSDLQASVPNNRAEDLLPQEDVDTAPEETDSNQQAAAPTPEASPPANDPLMAEMRALRQQYAYNPEGTDNAVATENFNTWLQALQEATENPELLPSSPITLEIEYPLRACLPEPPANASVGVLVNPDGEIEGEPSLLKSTGYAGLNQQALDAVWNSEFPATGDYAAYSFNVEVLYDPESCVSLPSSSGEQTS
jgi:hypothetical protein